MIKNKSSEALYSLIQQWVDEEWDSDYILQPDITGKVFRYELTYKDYAGKSHTKTIMEIVNEMLMFKSKSAKWFHVYKSLKDKIEMLERRLKKYEEQK